MRLRTKQSYCTPEDRRQLADLISAIIMADFHTPFRPYVVGSEEKYWKLDNKDNWGLSFDPIRPNEFGIHYRYQHAENPQEEALATWLCCRIGARPV